jgi:hypothetical protein
MSLMAISSLLKSKGILPQTLLPLPLDWQSMVSLGLLKILSSVLCLTYLDCLYFREEKKLLIGIYHH